MSTAYSCPGEQPYEVDDVDGLVQFVADATQIVLPVSSVRVPAARVPAPTIDEDAVALVDGMSAYGG
jgi:hypothetical protein